MNILDHIGNTPLLKLNKVNEVPDVEIYVKCEFMNPGGSTKDRMALHMIEEAEKSGELKPGGTIVDQSSGNTGPALAFVGAVKGYDVRLFLPTHLSGSYDPSDRIRIAKIYGCEVMEINMAELVPNLETLDDVEKAATAVATRMKQCYDLQQSDSSVWWSNQLCNPNNTNAHRDGMGKEIIAQMDGKVDAWVASIGTGGTLLGVAEALKEVNPNLHIFAVMPDDDPRLKWIQSRAAHKILEDAGMKDVRFLLEDILDKNMLDEQIVVENEDAKKMADRLSNEEGLFCGISSGANVYAAIQTAKKMKKGSKIVTVLVDRRDRYFAEYPNERYVV